MSLNHAPFLPENRFHTHFGSFDSVFWLKRILELLLWSLSRIQRKPNCCHTEGWNTYCQYSKHRTLPRTNPTNRSNPLLKNLFPHSASMSIQEATPTSADFWTTANSLLKMLYGLRKSSITSLITIHCLLTAVHLPFTLKPLILHGNRKPSWSKSASKHKTRQRKICRLPILYSS